MMTEVPVGIHITLDTFIYMNRNYVNEEAP